MLGTGVLTCNYKASDGNMAPQGSSNKDPLYIPRGPITRAKAKRIKEDLNSLI